MDVTKQDWYVLSKKQKEKVCQCKQMDDNLCTYKVYKIWSNAQKKTLTVLPSGLSLNDVWSLFSTHWLTDKVVNISFQYVTILLFSQVITTFLQKVFKC